MIEHETTFRVRYGETDQMGYVYYGNYAEYFEVGRVEMLRNLGITYKNLEEDGILLPVSELHIKYIKPALYDDELTLTTQLVKLSAVRIEFTYTMRNSDDFLICEAATTLVFINKLTGKPCRCPQHLADAINKRERMGGN